MRNPLPAVIPLVLTALLLTACENNPIATDQAQEPVAPALAKRDKPGPPGRDRDKIPLDVTVRDANEDGVRSDGGGIYSHGSQLVEAVIMGNGNLSFSMKDSERCTFLDFGDFSWSGTCETTRTSTGDPEVEGGFPALMEGEFKHTRSQVTWVADGKNWFLRYGRDCAGDGAGGDVDENRILVTRVDEDTWTYATNDKDGVEPNAFLCNSNVRGKPGVDLVAEVHVPFGLTLVQQL